MDAAGLLGAVANELRSLTESDGSGAAFHLQEWLDAFPIVQESVLARMDAARSLPHFEAARQEFARTQARRAPAVRRFSRALRERSLSDQMRWSWAVRGYARAVVRFLIEVEQQARVSSGRVVEEAQPSEWSPLHSLALAAETPYRKRLRDPAQPLPAAVDALGRVLAWAEQRRAASAEFKQQVNVRDHLLARARRLSAKAKRPIPETAADLTGQVTGLRRWLRETQWERKAAVSRAASDHARERLGELQALVSDNSTPGVLESLATSLPRR